MAKKKSQKPDVPPLGESLDELASIVEILESGEQPIEEMMDQFERAMMLVRSCHERLDEQARRIEVVVSVNNGQVETKPFQTESRNDEVQKRSQSNDDLSE